MRVQVPLTGSVPPFFLIRHGETNWNREGRLQGQRDIPLNAVGRDQAAAAGRRLQGLLRRRGLVEPEALRVVASPLGRARDTAERVRTAMHLVPLNYELDDRLKEISFGVWEGLTWREVKARDPQAVKRRKHDKWVFAPPEGESYATLAERLRPWLASVRPFDVVVAHGGVARALMWLAAGVPATDAPDIDIMQGRVLIFEQGRHAWD